MALQRGNVETNEGDRPVATLTLAAFRAQFTEEHRKALLAAILARREHLRRTLRESGVTERDVGPMLDADSARAREALRLLAQLHPPPFEW
jgi:hypothetical protein